MVVMSGSPAMKYMISGFSLSLSCGIMLDASRARLSIFPPGLTIILTLGQDVLRSRRPFPLLVAAIIFISCGMVKEASVIQYFQHAVSWFSDLTKGIAGGGVFYF